MPKKGDDLDALTVKTVIEHHSNTEVMINNILVDAIFDHAEIIENDVLVERPVLTIATDDTLGLSKDDPVVAGSKKFTYSYQKDDGTGMTMIVLKGA